MPQSQNPLIQKIKEQRGESHKNWDVVSYDTTNYSIDRLLRAFVSCRHELRELMEELKKINDQNGFEECDELLNTLLRLVETAADLLDGIEQETERLWQDVIRRWFGDLTPQFLEGIFKRVFMLLNPTNLAVCAIIQMGVAMLRGDLTMWFGQLTDSVDAEQFLRDKFGFVPDCSMKERVIVAVDQAIRDILEEIDQNIRNQMTVLDTQLAELRTQIDRELEDPDFIPPQGPAPTPNPLDFIVEVIGTLLMGLAAGAAGVIRGAPAPIQQQLAPMIQQDLLTLPVEARLQTSPEDLMRQMPRFEQMLAAATDALETGEDVVV